MSSTGSLGSMLWTALLSLLSPGVGHMALGRWRAGIGFAVARVAVVLVGLWLMVAAPSPAAAVIDMAGGVIVTLVAVAMSVLAARQSGRDAGAPTVPATLALLVVTLIANLGVAAVSRASLGQAFRVPSESMQPTLEVGDCVVVDRRGTSRDFALGDIVAYRAPENGQLLFLKRVVALAGDTVELRDRVLYRNGQVVNEPFVMHLGGPYEPRGTGPRDNLDPLVVPAGHVFMLGDNRENSLDSRFHGPIALENVLGRATGIYMTEGKGPAGDRAARIGKALR